LFPEEEVYLLLAASKPSITSVPELVAHSSFASGTVGAYGEAVGFCSSQG